MSATAKTGGSKMLTVAQAAKALGVGHKLVRQMVRAGTLKGVRLGAAIRVPVAEVERLAAAGAA